MDAQVDGRDKHTNICTDIIAQHKMLNRERFWKVKNKSYLLFATLMIWGFENCSQPWSVRNPIWKRQHCMCDIPSCFINLPVNCTHNWVLNTACVVWRKCRLSINDSLSNMCPSWRDFLVDLCVHTFMIYAWFLGCLFWILFKFTLDKSCFRGGLNPLVISSSALVLFKLSVNQPYGWVWRNWF